MLKTLHNAVTQFKLDTGQYPSEDGGLNELIEQPTDLEGWAQGGYLDTTEVPKDAWKHEFIYQLYPESGKPFVIISYGADGKEGGEGYDADLYSTDAQ
jgi:general secretion pathway protein G